MSFAVETGYSPVSFESLMNDIREAINTQFGTDYTEGTFIGTNWYKYFYTLIQKVQENETKTAEIFAKLQEYISSTNERIQRPSSSLPGIIDSFESLGYTASVRDNASSEAGTIAICVDLDDEADDFAEKKLAVCNQIKDYVAGGLVSQGSQVETIVLTNGQSFDFKFDLPNRIAILLRLTLTTSDNSEELVPDDEAIRQQLFDNIAARYRLGWDFEPQRYYTTADAPWAATILTEYSPNAGTSWYATVVQAQFKDLYEFGLEDITVSVDPP